VEDDIEDIIEEITARITELNPTKDAGAIEQLEQVRTRLEDLV